MFLAFSVMTSLRSELHQDSSPACTSSLLRTVIAGCLDVAFLPQLLMINVCFGVAVPEEGTSR